MTLLGFRGVHPIMLFFFPFALAALSGGFWLLWRRPGAVSKSARRVYLASYACMALAFVLGWPLARAQGKYLLMYYLCAVAAFAVPGLLLAGSCLAGKPRVQGPHQPSRRRFLAGGTVAVAGGLISLAGVEALAGDGPQVAERRIEVERHPKARGGRELRLSLVTDLHAGFFLPGEHLEQALVRIEAFRPDAILFGGDLVENELGCLDQTRSFLEGLAAMAPAFAVIGNHDTYISADAVAAFLRLRGVIPLRGECAPLAGPWGSFTLCGMRDVFEPELDHGILRRNPPETTIMLAHNPQQALMASAGAVPWLTLSGHTHGGQIRLPGVGALVNQADRRIGPGLNRVDGRMVAVSAGLGYSGLPVRLGCPPDVTNIVVS